MGSYNYRCPKCNTGRATVAGLLAHVEQCKTVRCPGCRTRFSKFRDLIAHQKTTKHAACDCGHGYHHPHRPGAPGCAQQEWDVLFNQPAARKHRANEPIPF